jgi:hypothetical protein
LFTASCDTNVLACPFGTIKVSIEIALQVSSSFDSSLPAAVRKLFWIDCGPPQAAGKPEELSLELDKK